MYIWISLVCCLLTQDVLGQSYPPPGQGYPPPGPHFPPPAFGPGRHPYRFPPPPPQHTRGGYENPEPAKPVGPIDWRMCYVCSGMFPDRECELYPKYVTKGPGKINCTRSFCTSFVRYTPKKTVLEENKENPNPKSLTPEDFEVDSIARECEDVDRGNKCEFDGDKKALTCYATCKEDYCNDVTPSPSLKDFGKAEPTEEEAESKDDMVKGLDKVKSRDNRRGFEPPSEEPVERPRFRGGPPDKRMEEVNEVDNDTGKPGKDGSMPDRRGRKGGPRLEGSPGNKTLSNNRKFPRRRGNHGGKPGEASSQAGNSTASAHSLNFQPINSFLYSFCLISGLFVFNVGAFTLNQ